jgi:hypothetical protein
MTAVGLRCPCNTAATATAHHGDGCTVLQACHTAASVCERERESATACRAARFRDRVLVLAGVLLLSPRSFVSHAWVNAGEMRLRGADDCHLSIRFFSDRHHYHNNANNYNSDNLPLYR